MGSILKGNNTEQVYNARDVSSAIAFKRQSELRDVWNTLYYIPMQQYIILY